MEMDMGNFDTYKILNKIPTYLIQNSFKTKA